MDISDSSKIQDDLAEKHSQNDPASDAVFGEITEEGPNYRNVGFLGTVILMMKTQFGLGVLSIPGAFDALGIVPGVICLCAIGFITTWSDYIIGTFKRHHSEVYGIDDAGGLIFGRIGRVILSVAFCLFSSHGACTAIFVAIAAILGFITASVRTLGRITWLAWIGLPCLLVAIFTVVIAVGIQDRPAAAPQTDTAWVSDYKIVGNPTFVQAIAGVSQLVFAYSGTPGFFAIVSEMRNPRQYTQALLICQTSLTALYIIIGCVVYYYCGSYVSSPALGSAGTIVKKISYGIALPGLIVTTTIVAHIPGKYIFIHILRGSKHLNSNSPTHWITWLSCVFGVTVVAYIIASAIPVFEALVSLIGALLGSLMCFQPMGCMWLYDNWNKHRGSKRWWLMACWSVFVITVGTFLMIAGTYGSVVGIIDTYRATGGSTAFSCADNSNSV